MPPAPPAGTPRVLGPSAEAWANRIKPALTRMAAGQVGSMQAFRVELRTSVNLVTTFTCTVWMQCPPPDPTFPPPRHETRTRKRIETRTLFPAAKGEKEETSRPPYATAQHAISDVILCLCGLTLPAFLCHALLVRVRVQVC